MADQFRALVISQYWVGKNVFLLVSFNFNFDWENFFPLQIPNENSNLCHIIISLSQIMNKDIFA